MKQWWLSCMMIFVLLLGIAPVDAQDDERQTVEIAVYVLGASEFNLDTGIYSVDFFMSMTCSLECTDEIIGFDIVGINGTESLQIEERIRDPFFVEYRIQAILNQNEIDLSQFPFDSHRLKIIIESKTLQTDQLVYADSSSDQAIDPDVILQGWELNDTHTVEVTEKTYGGESGFSRYTFTMTVKRVAAAAFIRSILPALVIMTISILGTFLPDRNQRIGLAGGILLAMLLHHLAVSAEIPPVGYPVYFDAFMLLNDAAILLQFAGTVYELVREKNGVDDAILDRFSYVSLAVIVIAWLIAQGLVWQIFMG